MEPITFPESNTVLRRPPSMTEEECGSLDVYADGAGWVSCWRPSWRERLSVLLFGRVWLGVLGQSHPPMWVSGNRTVFAKTEVAKAEEEGA